jgi:hypothetical protein
MEEWKAREIFQWLVEEEKPARFVGKKNKESWKSWKKSVKLIEVKKKCDEKELSVKNSIFMKTKNGKMKIIVREHELKEVWETFHCDEDKGGHQGVNGMENRIGRHYIIPHLRKWLSKKVKECKICEQVRRKQIIPPSAPFLAKEKSKMWQIDYIGKFPCDAKTGHWFVFCEAIFGE